MNVIQWKDGMYADIGSVGYGDDSTTDFRINNDIGSIKLCAVDYVNVVGDLQVNGIGIHITYATKTEVTDQLGLKVDKVAGKQLSTEDFTTDYKLKLGALFAGTISVPSEGYVTTRDVSNALAKKLTIASNLSDLSSITVARRNMSVYSIAEVDDLLSKKLSINQAYTGVTFSSVDKVKLDSLKTGTFTSSSAVQVEGYVTTSSVATELSKKANLLMDGYSSTQKNTIASNLGVYTKSDADSRFASPSNSFQDYITFLVNQGNSTSTAQQILRDKLNTPSKEDLSNSYIRRDGKLSDLDLSNEDAKKQVCRTLGAAYADDCQSKLTDTGWVQMGNSGGVTDTSNLFIRQIGNTVCIQGKVNTGKKNGTHNGGIVAVIPNQISPPKYSLRCALCDFNDDHKYNRGASFVISGNSRNVQIYESGWNNVNTEINFTYMT